MNTFNVNVITIIGASHLKKNEYLIIGDSATSSHFLLDFLGNQMALAILYI